MTPGGGGVGVGAKRIVTQSEYYATRRRHRGLWMSTSTTRSQGNGSSGIDGGSNKSNSNGNNVHSLSIAILGGGISGLSCASQLLSRHKQLCSSHSSASSQYKLEVTVFDTGRLRPGGRCSSRLPADDDDDAALPPPPPLRTTVVNKVAEEDRRSNRRACDNDAAGDGIDSGNANNTAGVQTTIPMNIQQAINNNGKSTATKMGPVDHAAQILSIPPSYYSSSDSYAEFRTQLQSWLDDGIIEEFPTGSVCELVSVDTSSNRDDVVDDGNRMKTVLSSVDGKEMYYGRGGMGSIPMAMREHCLSFNHNYDGDDAGDGWRSFRIMQDVWVSPSNGVKYIGAIQNNDGVTIHDEDNNRDDDVDPRWELMAGKKSLGKYHRLVIAHNGKCGKLCTFMWECGASVNIPPNSHPMLVRRLTSLHIISLNCSGSNHVPNSRQGIPLPVTNTVCTLCSSMGWKSNDAQFDLLIGICSQERETER